MGRLILRSSIILLTLFYASLELLDACLNEERDCFENEVTECQTPSSYTGNKSTTVSEFTCQKWALDSPHSHSYNDLPSNYCRNPDSDSGPWCYTTDPEKKWEYCFNDCKDPCVSEERECLEFGDLCQSTPQYTGNKSTTLSGRTCQEWASNSPQSHEFHHPTNACLDEVRDCWATDCPISDYTGTKSTTLSGWTCQEWALDTPHSHSYNNLPSNYCRSLGLDDDTRPWCFVTEPGERWEYCFNHCPSSPRLTIDSSTSQILPNPTPTTLPKSTSTTLHNPTSTSLPNPTSTSLQNPTSPSLANPTSTSLANPTSTSLPNPTSTSLPNPTPTTLRKSTSTTLHNPTSTSLPNPTSTSLANPTSTSLPNPTSTSLPNPTPTTLRKSTSTTLHNPTSTSLQNPTSTSLANPTSTSLPNPTSTSLPNPTPTTLRKSTSTTLHNPTSTSLPNPTFASLPNPTSTNLPITFLTNLPIVPSTTLVIQKYPVTYYTLFPYGYQIVSPNRLTSVSVKSLFDCLNECRTHLQCYSFNYNDNEKYCDMFTDKKNPRETVGPQTTCYGTVDDGH